MFSYVNRSDCVLCFCTKVGVTWKMLDELNGLVDQLFCVQTVQMETLSDRFLTGILHLVLDSRTSIADRQGAEVGDAQGQGAGPDRQEVIRKALARFHDLAKSRYAYYKVVLHFYTVNTLKKELSAEMFWYCICICFYILWRVFLLADPRVGLVALWDLVAGSLQLANCLIYANGMWLVIGQCSDGKFFYWLKCISDRVMRYTALFKTCQNCQTYRTKLLNLSHHT